MRDTGNMLWMLIAVCVIAFIGFAIASLLTPSDRGPLQASASAFMVGTALAVAAQRIYSEQCRRLEKLERRLEQLESEVHSEL